MEAQLECRTRIEEAHAHLRNEQVHTRSVEELLKQEKAKSMVLHGNVAAAQKQSCARLDERKGQVDAATVEGERMINDARRAAEARMAVVERRCAAELQDARNRLAGVKMMCDERVANETVRALEAEYDAEVRCNTAVKRLDADKLCMKHHTSILKQDGVKHVQRVQKREDATSVRVSDQVNNLSTLFNEIEKKALEVQRKELQSNTSLNQSVHVLRQHLATRHQCPGIHALPKIKC